MNWIDLAQNKNYCKALVDATLILRVPQAIYMASHSSIDFIGPLSCHEYIVKLLQTRDHGA